MKLKPKQNARILYRVWGPVAERLDRAAAMDAGFDAGEFSDHFHAVYRDRLFSETVERVAGRLGISAAELRDNLEDYYAAWERVFRV